MQVGCLTGLLPRGAPVAALALRRGGRPSLLRPRFAVPSVSASGIRAKGATMKITRVRARIAVLAGVGALALAAPLTAVASAPEPVRIETRGVFTGPDSTAGTFTISGAVSDSGTASPARLCMWSRPCPAPAGRSRLRPRGSCAGRHRRRRRSSPATGGSSPGPAHMRISKEAAPLARPDRRTSPPGPSMSSTKDGPRPTDVPRDARDADEQPGPSPKLPHSFHSARTRGPIEWILSARA